MVRSFGFTALFSAIRDLERQKLKRDVGEDRWQRQSREDCLGRQDCGHKRRIAFFHHPKGALVVDDGAKAALREREKSLLKMGIARCEGDFAAGDVVRICDSNGTGFAQGITRFSKSEIENNSAGKVVVHRDDLVIL